MKKNQFIFTDCRGHPIVYIKTTGVDRDAENSNIIQAPQEPPHKFYTTEEAEEEPVIPYPNIDLDMNQNTPT